MIDTLLKARPALERYKPRVAVLIPCFNEEATVATVIKDFHAALPGAEIYVFDNNSTDGTVEVAQRCGAIVRRETRQGKGHVVRRMFADVEADVYIMTDGDATYDAAAAPAMVGLMLERRLDFINGARVAASRDAYRPTHRFGNRLLTGAVRMIFGRDFSDMLSGYKVFSRRYVTSFPAMARGFEIETEFTIHALELQMPCAEMPTNYRERPAGSASKLRTIPDGVRILLFILKLVKDERPLMFFGSLAAASVLLALVLGTPILVEYWRTGLVPRLPTAVLSASLINLGALLLVCGLVLDTVTKARRELKRLAYIAARDPR
jgi:glycosyltransferase involved in cell wall biosynthesis